MTPTIRVGPAPEDVQAPADSDLRMWSVTTLIGCLDKPAIPYWSAEETAKAAVESHGTVGSMIEEQGPDAAVDWLKGARFRQAKPPRTARSDPPPFPHIRRTGPWL